MEEDLPKSYTLSSAWRTAASLLLYILVYYAIFRDLKSILLLVIVIIIHEGGHFFAMKKFGYKDMKMFFIPFFGAFVSGKTNLATPVQRAIMILSGPLPGILIGSFLFTLSIIFHSKYLLQPALLFMVLNAINLLPVSPLDGGQFLQILFPSSNKLIQTIFILLLIIVTTWLAFRTRNYFLLILEVFLFYRLSILFGDKIQHNEKPEKQESVMDESEIDALTSIKSIKNNALYEMSPSAKTLLLLSWLAGILIPIISILYMALNRDSSF